MMGRKVHLRPSTVINLGHTKTLCGRVIYWAPYQDMSNAVVTFSDFDATHHATLVTCHACLKRMRATLKETPNAD